MLIFTAKMDRKRLVAALAVVIVAIVLLLVFGSRGSRAVSAGDAAVLADTDQARVQFLTGLGWDVTPVAAETREVRIPRDADEVFTRYNALQQSQGYDLSRYAGKRVMRYVYQISNYPNAAGPVYATLLVCKGQLIGGDITDTAPGGQVRGFHALSQP